CNLRFSQPHRDKPWCKQIQLREPCASTVRLTASLTRFRQTSSANTFCQSLKALYPISMALSGVMLLIASIHSFALFAMTQPESGSPITPVRVERIALLNEADSIAFTLTPDPLNTGM